MKIHLVVNSLVQGGAQRFTVDFATELVKHGNNVKITTFYPEETDFFELPRGLEVNRFTYPFQDRGRTPSRIFKRQMPYKLMRIFWRVQDLIQIRKLILTDKPDLVIAVERYVGVLLSAITPSSVTLLISERVHPQYHKMSSVFGKFDSLLLPILFSRKNIFLHAQGFDIGKYIKSEFKKPVVVIPNFVHPHARNKGAGSRKKIVLGVGRYSEQKGFDLLIDAWSKINSNAKENWELHIYGDGSHEELHKRAKRLGCEQSVKLYPATQDVLDLYRNASIFVLSSRYEGFPNVLAEALASGVACIATDSPSAVRDLTLNGKIARLVPIDSSELALALMFLMENERERNEYAELGLSVAKHFSTEKVMPMWLDLLPYLEKRRWLISQDCPICLTKLSFKHVREVKTKSQIRAELDRLWEIEYSGEIDSEELLIHRLRCPKCKVEFFDSSPGKDDFYRSCFESSNYQRESIWDYKLLIEKVLETREDVASLKFLDVGSGNSKLTKLLLGSNQNIDIVEIDDSTFVSQASKIRKRYKDLEDVNEKYDVVIISHYLEHVANPIETLKKIKSICNKSSIIAVTVPNAAVNDEFDSPLDWPPHHTFRFSPDALTNISHMSGFRISSINFQNSDSKSSFDFCMILTL